MEIVQNHTQTSIVAPGVGDENLNNTTTEGGQERQPETEEQRPEVPTKTVFSWHYYERDDQFD